MLNVDEIVYKALKADAAITAAVGDNITHNGNWNGGTYPAITYMEISNIPGLNSDDAEDMARLTEQVIVFYTGNANELIKAVEKTMLGLGFLRQSYHDVDFDNAKGKVMRFTIIGKGN